MEQPRHSSSSPLAVPEVSLITSWRAPAYGPHEPAPGGHLHRTAPGGEWLNSVELALGHGLSVLDLYYLATSEVEWYAGACTRGAPDVFEPEPLTFAASLRAEQLDCVAARLTDCLTKTYSGKLVGRRPRFAALATYFPEASSLDDQQRVPAVRAIRSAVYLAHKLGCHCVEIVGGSRLPWHTNEDLVTHAEQRLAALVQTILAVYAPVEENPLCSAGVADWCSLPALSVELEPGAAFLLHDLEAFAHLKQRLWEAATAASGTTDATESNAGLVALNRTQLNLDVAHCLIAGIGPDDLARREVRHSWDGRTATTTMAREIVCHMHVSDHGADLGQGGIHASDLVLGTYHAQDEYLPWLALAIRLTNYSEVFSGTVAVEMEASNDLRDVTGAVHITRRWLEETEATYRPLLRQEVDSQFDRTFSTGAVIVFDLGRSTKLVTAAGSVRDGSRALEAKIEQLAQTVHAAGGSVMSYTGDGLIGTFTESECGGAAGACTKALAAAAQARELTVGWNRELAQQGIPPDADVLDRRLSLRVAIHWGEAYIPRSGRLRDQLIGATVVCATRLCDFLARTVEEASSPTDSEVLVAVTSEFYDLCPATATGRAKWVPLGPKAFKGISNRVDVYLQKTKRK